MTEKSKEQKILNNLAIRYLIKAKDNTRNKRLLRFADSCISKLESDTSNATYDELNQIASYNNEADTSTERVMKQLRCTYPNFRKLYSGLITRLKHKGNLSQVDVDIINEKLNNKS